MRTLIAGAVPAAGLFGILFFFAHLALFLMRDCRIVGKQHDLVLRGHRVIPEKH